MQTTLTETNRVILLFIMMFLLCGVELIFPLIKSKRSSILRTLPNIVMTLLLILTNFLVAGIVSFVGFAVEKYKLGLFQNVGQIQSMILIITGVIILDFLGAYLPHALMHKIPFMWRFHAVHHSDIMIDVTTAFRQHPSTPIHPNFRFTRPSSWTVPPP